MSKIISLLISFLNFLNKQLFRFSSFLTLRSQSYEDKKCASDKMPLYRKYEVDPLPIVKDVVQPKSFEQAKLEYETKNGKPLKPINRTKESSQVDDSITCPCCNASSEYIYDNTGKQKNFECKVCKLRFSKDTTLVDQISHHCPYCDSKLETTKERSDFTVKRCPNKKCSFFMKNLKKLTKKERERHKTHPHEFRLHYRTRIFSASLEKLKELYEVIKPSKVDLSTIRNSAQVLGLILTYNINYGLSYRKTALIMLEVHNIKISHQTVANYAQAAANLLDGWLKNYKYKTMSLLHCGDETYIKIKGKMAYVFFMCDSVTKIITSYTVFLKRDTFSAIQTFYSVIRKFETLPEGLKIIVDGNPIYLVAQQYFQLMKINFEVLQVIGLTNQDENAKKYRPQKQIIERLNRTFKYSYYGKNGFASEEHANNYMTLFTVYFNFLRKHSSLGYKTPTEFCFGKDINMPSKWNTLLASAILYHNREHLKIGKAIA